jgi:glycosyltransferase involved in cell wall biosynthesis
VKLAVYLPALNEATTIGELLDAIPRNVPGITSLETIVVDDGSSDGTAELAALHGATVVRHPRNLGTGRAFMSGVRAALASGADIVVGMDADGQFAPRDIAALVAPLVSQTADVALCTRFGPHSALSGRMPILKRFGNWLLCKIISVAAEQKFTDVSCGFRAFTRDAALRVDIHSDFEYIHESLLTWHRCGQRVVEVELPVRAERADGASRAVSSVTYNGLRTAPILIGALRNYSPLMFFGSLAVLAFGVSMLIAGGIVLHWWGTADSVDYTPAVIVCVGGVLLAALLGTVGVLADRIARLNFQVEDVLHAARRGVPGEGASTANRGRPTDRIARR